MPIHARAIAFHPAGEMLLDIETRIGELAEKEEKSLPVSIGGKAGWKPSNQPLKHERLGMTEKHMQQSQTIETRIGELLPKIEKKGSSYTNEEKHACLEGRA